MASLKFRHYATESDLKGTGTIQAALNTFDVGTIVFIDSTQKQYIITQFLIVMTWQTTQLIKEL